MLPVNQQNLSFLSISTDNSKENSNIGVGEDNLSGFENLFSAYVSPLEDENIAGIGNASLPLSATPDAQILAENVTISFSSASDPAVLHTSVADEISTQAQLNVSTGLQIDTTVNYTNQDSIIQPLNQTLSNGLTSLSDTLNTADIDVLSTGQQNTNNVSVVTSNTGNQQTASPAINPTFEPALLNLVNNGLTTTQNLKINIPQNNEINQSIVNHKLNTQSNLNNYFNKISTNHAQVSSLDIAIDEQNYSSFLSLDNTLKPIEPKLIAAADLAIHADNNSQLTPNQTLLSINKTIALNSAPAESHNTTDITNSSDIAKQMVLAHQNGTQQIRLLITPEHLGAVDINIQDTKEGVNIQILTNNLAAKESLEAFMPRLREMLEQSGVNIQDATIEHKQQNNDSSFDTNYQQANEDKNNQLDQQDSTEVKETNILSTNFPLSDHIVDAFA